MQIWLIVLLLLGLVLALKRRSPRAQAPIPANSPRMPRRHFLVGSGVVCLGGFYGYGVEREMLELTQVEVPLAGLPPELEGLRLVLMADWHCGPRNPQGYLRRAMDLANQARPDLILIPGDFVKSKPAEFALAAELVARLKPRLPGGVLATLGNHDHAAGADECRRQLGRAGATFLDNRALRLTPQGELRQDWDGPGLCLAGVGDLWGGKVRMRQTLEPVPSGIPRLVLAHNPDTAERYPVGPLDLMVSGHTHGGQVRLPLIGAPILPSAYGSKYAQGWVQGPGYPVYVTRGVGVGSIPVRCGVRPEITVLRLTRKIS